MKGPGIKDYEMEIMNRKEFVKNSGNEFFEISSKELHNFLSPNNDTMPTCCLALYKLMLKGDEILQRPRGMTGFGSYLRIRFYVNDLDTRERYAPLKKRGRPNKNDLQIKSSKIKRGKLDNLFLIMLTGEWLEKHNISFRKENDCIVANTIEGSWSIQAEGIKRGRRKDFSKTIIDFLSEPRSRYDKRSLVLNDEAVYRSQWQKIDEQNRKLLNMSIILVDKKGRIREL